MKCTKNTGGQSAKFAVSVKSGSAKKLKEPDREVKRSAPFLGKKVPILRERTIVFTSFLSGKLVNTDGHLASANLDMSLWNQCLFLIGRYSIADCLGNQKLRRKLFVELFNP